MARAGGASAARDHGRAAITLILTAMTALGCPSRTSPPASGEARDEERLAEQVKIVLESHCGACHMSILSTALPDALAVFDLSDGDGWDRGMTRERWASALGRLEHAAPDMGRPEPATPAEITLVRRYAGARHPDGPARLAVP
jgi:hypothetical protein